ncbi:glycoside hydrolase family 127 protein [candidate division KSB1 bacterium]|nr:glycoside hydrolase family 127 protein [candidate division KSB1 bacterium]
MRKKILTLIPVILAGGLFFSSRSKSGIQSGHYPIQPVPFTAVKLTDKFWAPRIVTNYKVTIPIAIQQCYTTGRVDNFKIAGKFKSGKFKTEYPFDDTDIYKLIEAASYSLQTIPDKALEAQLDSLIYYVGLAQEPDGYLYTNRTIDSLNTHPWAGKKRWEKTPELSHELYNCGHLYEAAVAHYLATGKFSLLEIAEKNAQLLVEDFGPGKLLIYPGHQVVEMGLVKLYNVTGKKEYLDLAKFFLDVRGPGGEEYCQAHQKVVDQTEPVGHAVRATYMYSGMADIAAMYNDTSYIHAVQTIWENLVTQKTYITGGIGSGGGNEGFDPPYVLPNMSAYCETCASVGDIFWNYRMFLYDGDSKYYDVIERVLYNSFLSGVSISGDRFFYPNVLESFGQHERSKWFGCACCPPNVARLLPSIPGYIYANDDKNVYVNLFMANHADIEFQGIKLEIEQETEYPWDGRVVFKINPESSVKFDFKVRIPGWARNEVIPGNLYVNKDDIDPKVFVSVNEEKVDYRLIDGYATLSRKWKRGDQVVLDLPMDVRKIAADPRVEADRGRMAIQRGPVVFCAEWPFSFSKRVLNLLFSDSAQFEASYNDTLYNGIKVIHTTARATSYNNQGTINIEEPEPVFLIPYFAWNNRGAGEMMVWLPVNDSAVKPLPAPTIASKSKITAQKQSKSLFALCDQYEPKNSNDHSWPFYHWWPDNNQWMWVQYDFEQVETISKSKVYWFDDGPYRGCRIPAQWELEYKTDLTWEKIQCEYPVIKDGWSIADFSPIKASALRLKVKLPEENSSGIHEWVVE